jgi:death on curing protein
LEPLFLELEEVLEIHRDQIARYGDGGGIRDMAFLHSAMAMPRAGIGEEYFHADLIEMAGAYLFHIVKNHPFVDGNKRVGAVAAFIFLRLNGYELKMTNPVFEKTVRAVADGSLDKAALTAVMRKYVKAENLHRR